MAQIIIADISAYDPVAAAGVTLRYATQAYVTGPADTPANTFYEPRIQQPADMQRNCFGQNSTYGATTVGYGDMVLVNSDGALDGLLGYGFSGWPIEIRLGTITQAMAAPSWTTLIKGTIEQVDVSWSKITIRVRDRQQDLTVPLQTNMYGGTNALPLGVDGVATDLKGKRKPLVYGTVYGIAPPCVNTSKLIYQASDVALNSVDAVYDRGMPLTAGVARTSQTDMETNAPAVGRYDYWLAGGCIRLGSSPAGTVTLDCTQGATAGSRTAAQVMKAIMLKGGVAGGNISAADVSALDAACGYPLGVYLPHDQDTSGAALLDVVANSVGAFWGADRLGNFRMAQVVAPSAGLAVGTLTGVEVLSIDRVATNDAGGGVPSWSVVVGYGRIYAPSSDLAAGVSDAERARQREEYRTVNSQAAALKTTYPTSPELRFDTQLLAAADAQAEAARRQALYGVRRDMYQVRVRLDDTLAATLDLGKVVLLKLPRYDLGSGKPFLISALRANAQANFFDLTLWG